MKTLPVFIKRLLLSGKLIILFLTVFSSGMYPGNAARFLTVAGFLNLGEKTDNHFNEIITKSLSFFLSKIPGMDSVSYDEIEKTALEKGYWTENKQNTASAVELGRLFGSGRVITGNYVIDHNREIITIHVLIINADNGEIELERSYNGPGGVGIFDTIDNIILEISGFLLEHPVKLGSLSVSVAGTTNRYLVFLYDRQIGSVSTGEPFKEEMIAFEKLKISLKLNKTNEEVYSSDFILKENEKKEIVYKPEAVPAVPALPDYRGTWVLMDIALPGFAQFQANDTGMGCLFSICGAGGAVFFIYSIANFYYYRNDFLNAGTQDRIDSSYDLMNRYREMSLAGLAIYAGIAALSIIHASIQPSLWTAGTDRPFYIAMNNNEISFCFGKRF